MHQDSAQNPSTLNSVIERGPPQRNAVSISQTGVDADSLLDFTEPRPNSMDVDTDIDVDRHSDVISRACPKSTTIQTSDARNDGRNETRADVSYDSDVRRVEGGLDDEWSCHKGRRTDMSGLHLPFCLRGWNLGVSFCSLWLI